MQLFIKKCFASGRRSSNLTRVAKVSNRSHPSNLALHNTTLIISNKEMNDIMKKIKSLKESVVLKKGISKTIKMEAKEQKRGFLSILLSTLGASLLGNLLTGKSKVRAGEGTVRADHDF